MTPQLIGYLALAISLISMNMTSMRRFRWLHLVASSLYLLYGLLIDEAPMAIGGALFAMIHCYRLVQLYRAT